MIAFPIFMLRHVLPIATRSLALASVLAGPCLGLAQESAPPLPSFEELEAAGATIGEIRIRNQNIFDTEDPKEDKLLFRWANALHIQTRVGVIERALLFSSGEPLSVRLIDETEHVLRTVDPGWLSNVGFGLRIFSMRSAFSNVLHVDVAFPFNPNVSVKKVQFLVKTKTSF